MTNLKLITFQQDMLSDNLSNGNYSHPVEMPEEATNMNKEAPPFVPTQRKGLMMTPNAEAKEFVFPGVDPNGAIREAQFYNNFHQNFLQVKVFFGSYTIQAQAQIVQVDQLQDELTTAVNINKQQHQYIQNLQKANLKLKCDLKMVAAVNEAENQIPQILRPQEDYRMVSIGRVDKVTRHEVDHDEQEFEVTRVRKGQGNQPRHQENQPGNQPFNYDQKFKRPHEKEVHGGYSPKFGYNDDDIEKENCQRAFNAPRGRGQYNPRGRGGLGRGLALDTHFENGNFNEQRTPKGVNGFEPPRNRPTPKRYNDFSPKQNAAPKRYNDDLNDANFDNNRNQQQPRGGAFVRGRGNYHGAHHDGGFNNAPQRGRGRGRGFNDARCPDETEPTTDFQRPFRGRGRGGFQRGGGNQHPHNDNQRFQKYPPRDDFPAGNDARPVPFMRDVQERTERVEEEKKGMHAHYQRTPYDNETGMQNLPQQDTQSPCGRRVIDLNLHKRREVAQTGGDVLDDNQPEPNYTSDDQQDELRPLNDSQSRIQEQLRDPLERNPLRIEHQLPQVTEEKESVLPQVQKVVEVQELQQIE